MMVYLQLLYEFLKTGLFSIGGGMATIPFLKQIAERYDWFTIKELINMIAISESTPGPIGVNMATYAGYVAGGIVGGIIASLAVALPSLVISLMAANRLERFRNSKIVTDAFYGIRPAVAALIAYAALGIMKVSLLDSALYQTTGKLADLFKIVPIALFLILLYFTNRYKKHPIFYLAIAGIIGVLFKL